MNTAYTDILRKLAEKYHIGWIRRKHNSWCPKSLNEKIKEVMTSVIVSCPSIQKKAFHLSDSLRSRVLNEKWLGDLSSITRMTDYFNGYEQAIGFLGKGFYPKDNTIIELMCHPGHNSYINVYNKVHFHEIERFLRDVILCSYKTISYDR